MSFCLATQSAAADPSESLLTTYTQSDLRQIDMEAGSQNQTGQTSDSAANLGLGFGITEGWFSELYLSATRNNGKSGRFDSAALVNTLALTDGNSPIELGLYTELEYEQNRSEGYQATFGPLLQSEFGLTTINLNLLFSRDYLAEVSNRMQLDYQWQVKRRWNAAIEYGLQGFGELGEWDHWAPQNRQAHRIGPVILSRLALDPHEVIHYNAAVLFDMLDRRHGTEFRLQAIYGF